MARRLAAILSYDVVNYSGAIERNEGATLDGLRAHRQDVIEPAITRHNGQLIKFTGDGALVMFPSAVDAVRFAVDVQDGLAKRNWTLPDPAQLQYRIGVSIGDVVVEDEDVYGDGVNIATRIEALADTGGICIHRNVRDHLTGRIDVDFEDLGEIDVKNITTPVHVYRIRRRERASTSAAAPQAPGRAKPFARSGWRMIPAAAVVTILAVGLGWWFLPWQSSDGPVTQSPAGMALPDRPSIAVLLFVNFSKDPDQAYFTDGVSHEIVTALSRFSTLFVTSSESSFRYRGTSRPISRKLRANWG